jgi:hypothetical protein
VKLADIFEVSCIYSREDCPELSLGTVRIHLAISWAEAITYIVMVPNKVTGQCPMLQSEVSLLLCLHEEVASFIDLAHQISSEIIIFY